MKNKCGCLLGLMLLGATRITSAEVAAVDCVSARSCSTLMGAAQELSASGDLEQALQLYQRAYQLRSDPRLLYNIARLLIRQNHLQEAAAYLRQFISAPVYDEEQHKRVVAAQGALEKILSSLKEEPPATHSGSQLTPTGPQVPGEVIAALPATVPEVGPARPAEVSAKAPRAAPLPGRHGRWWLWTAVSGAAAGGLAVALTLGLWPRIPGDAVQLHF